MQERNCGTCRWFTPFCVSPNTGEEDRIGHCEWPAGRLPYSLRWGNRERTAVYPPQGTDCSCWEAKPAKEV